MWAGRRGAPFMGGGWLTSEIWVPYLRDAFNGSEGDGLGSASETRTVWSRHDGVALGSEVLFVMGT